MQNGPGISQCYEFSFLGALILQIWRNHLQNYAKITCTACKELAALGLGARCLVSLFDALCGICGFPVSQWGRLSAQQHLQLFELYMT